MAPLAMMMRNSSVMIPVMLYRMLMATAVVGAGPASLVGLELLSGAVLLIPITAAREEFCCRLLYRLFESATDVIVYMVGNLKVPVKVHSSEKRLYSRIALGIAFPAVITTEDPLMKPPVGLVGSQLMYAMSAEVTLFSFEAFTAVRFPGNLINCRRSLVTVPQLLGRGRTATVWASCPKPTLGVSGARL